MTMRRFVALAPVVLCALFIVAPLPEAEAQRARAGQRAAESGGSNGGSVKPYDEVITEDAASRRGLFTTHRVGDKLFFEIPTGSLGREMLWVSQIAGTQAGFSYAGMPAGDRVVRWELRDENILLRDMKFNIRADVDDPISIAVERTSVAPIIRVFPVQAWGKDKAPVIDVTDLFVSDQREFSARRRLNADGHDRSRSFIEEVKTFPENLSVKSLMTYTLSEQRPGAGGPPRRGARRDPSQSGVTALIHHSLVKLPDEPMQPRVRDERVGYFSVGFQDYGDDSDHEARSVRYITRWRLEKKDPDAEISDPVQPIVFYVGRETPEKWQPYVKKGIEAWLPAFEAAGFSNAIEGRYAPDPLDDPDWDAEDSRISTVRWLPSTTPNAFGPHVHDPRSGEIIEADVRMYHNVMKLVRDWYFVQASASDERAQKLPMPDELMGELIAFVVAHEVGHSIGLPHNMKSSSAYSIEQLRDPEWTKKHGTAPSIMDYARFNYVAQPEDGAGLLPQVGPYDYFSIEWGYRQFAEDADEKAELEKILKRQVDDPMLRFGHGGPGEDPTRQTEDLGDDPVEATRLGLKNIERIAGFLVDATVREGEDYSLLQNMHGALLGQWSRMMGHVVSVIGGVEEINLYHGDADRRYFPIDAERQREAMAFLNEHAFTTPRLFLDPDVLGRLEASGVTSRVHGAQSRLLAQVMSEQRLRRMAELAQESEGEMYSPIDMLEDLRAGLWSELERPRVSIELNRRSLQRAHVARLISALEGAGAASDMAGLARIQLRAVRAAAEGRIGRTADGVTEAHLHDIVARIEAALEP